MSVATKDIRNVVLLGHSGSGKTTFAETMLFESGAINRRGTVENQEYHFGLYQYRARKRQLYFQHFDACKLEGQ